MVEKYVRGHMVLAHIFTLRARITSIPSQIAFQISLFPDNIPRPQPKTSARLIGGLLHFTHFCVRVSRIRAVPDSDLGWEDMYREGEGDPWFDWVCIHVIGP